MTFSLVLQRCGSAIQALRAVPELAKRGGCSLKPAGHALAEGELQVNEDAGASLLLKAQAIIRRALHNSTTHRPSLRCVVRRICRHGNRS